MLVTETPDLSSISPYVYSLDGSSVTVAWHALSQFDEDGEYIIYRAQYRTDGDKIFTTSAGEVKHSDVSGGNGRISITDLDTDALHYIRIMPFRIVVDDPFNITNIEAGIPSQDSTVFLG